MATNFVQKGEIITWVNDTGAAVPVDAAVQLSHIIGVAQVNIADGESGSVAIEGTFTLPKVASAVFPVGAKLIWDASAKAFKGPDASTSTGDLVGPAIAIKPGVNGQTTCRVLLKPNNTTLV